ncbi:MAG: hypothetical protein P1V81_03030 [Planctomycetota bacterium]|nr:hypothetical protein [Planctomycetota bacterium]
MKKLTLVLGLALTSLACITEPAFISQDAQAYNKTLDQVANEQVLLNVVRAMERRPMRITEIGSIGMTRKQDASVSLPFPFHDWRGNTGKGSLGSSGSLTPSYDVTNMTSQEFMNGFMSPIDKDTFWNFWDGGWSREMLLFLLVDGIRLTWGGDGIDDATKKEHRVGNSPMSPSRFEAFQLLVAWADDWEVEVQPGKASAVGPELVGLSAQQLAGTTLAANEQGLELVALCATCKHPKGQQKALALEPCVTSKAAPKPANGAKGTDSTTKAGAAAPACDPKLASIHQLYRKGSKERKVRINVREEDDSAQINQLIALTNVDTRGGEPNLVRRELTNLTLEFDLRSPEGAIYYLGELMRAEPLWGSGFDRPIVDTSEVAQLTTSVGSRRQVVRSDWNLFRAIALGDKQSALLEVEFEGVRYGIPADGTAGRSMACIDMINQIVALQRKAKELSSTQRIRLIGN